VVFSSNLFLFGFLPAFLALYYTIPVRGRAVLIAVASYLFYGWWRVDFVSLMWLSTVLDYACGHRIAAIRAGGRGNARRWLLVSVIGNLGLLAYFKYCNFGIDNLNVLLAGLGFEGVGWPRVVLPVGISFYTFQTMSYTIDVYRGDARPVRSFGDFMCYVALFPQLVAGPIVRYQDVADQLVERTHSLDKFGEGARRFMVGFCKKVLVADSVAHIADAAFALPHPNFADAWLGALAYTVQLYFDFSGYSDMAIGLGLMIGFRFVENFDQPYRSQSITEFWQRWHISLSTWLRDYLYVPLGGNRHGERLREPRAGHAARRPLARRQLDICGLGRLARWPARHRTPPRHHARGGTAALPLPRAPAHALRGDRLGDVPRGERRQRGPLLRSDGPARCAQPERRNALAGLGVGHLRPRPLLPAPVPGASREQPRRRGLRGDRAAHPEERAPLGAALPPRRAPALGPELHPLPLLPVLR
jgi:D-alanyl-lipoteichoic acid acyltransferase DltB (MBOAT superfamily)